MTFKPIENGWLAAKVPAGAITKARERFEEQEGAAAAVGAASKFQSDHRWIGMLGEQGFDHWLWETLGIGAHVHNGGVDNKPDFEIRGRPVGLKTRYSNVATRADFFAVVPAQHFDRQQEDHWFFSNYETKAGRLVLLGGLDAAEFRDVARRVETGEPIGPTVRARNPVWQVPVEKLHGPYAWLCGLHGHELVGSTCRCGVFQL